jgi:threonine/homoserine/homoserine lactone efflux protein
MLEGIAAGFILSLTLFPGSVWLVKVGVTGRASQVIAVGLGFWLSQLIWLGVAVPGLMMMCRSLSFMSEAMYLFASFVLGYMGVKFLRTRKADNLANAGPLPAASTLFRNALNRSLAMPLRLPAAMTILLATGVYINPPPTWSEVPLVLLGALIGLSWWWGQMIFLAVFFAKRVPESITLKSLNKMRPLCAVLCFALAGIVLFMGL